MTDLLLYLLKKSDLFAFFSIKTSRDKAGCDEIGNNVDWEP